jgi:hypothetical protein
VTPPEFLPLHVRHQVEEIRQALLRLHKVLLEAERVDYEGEHGRVATSGEFLHLALHNSRFVWLHPLRALVVQMDELLAANDARAVSDASALIEQARTLLKPDEQGDAFPRRYHELLQEDPGVVMAHAEAVAVLRRAQ